jgi:hypothetical protein
MSVFKANRWVKSDGTAYNAIVNMQTITVGACQATPPSATYYTISGIQSQTNLDSVSSLLFRTTYTPILNDSYIVINCFLETDAGGYSAFGRYTQLWLFVNNQPVSAAYAHKRVQGHEPYNTQMTGTYTNNQAGPVNIDIRCSHDGGGGSFYLGKVNGQDQTMSNSINIIEVQK